MSEWQPIEDAPRDGTPILAFGVSHNNDDKTVGVVWWIAETVEHWEQTDDDTKKRKTEQVGWFNGAELLPTHWMPLPKPPAPSQEPA